MTLGFRVVSPFWVLAVVGLVSMPLSALPLTLEIPIYGESSGGPEPADDFEYDLSLDFVVVTNLDGNQPGEPFFNETRFELATVPIVVSDEAQTLIAPFDLDQLEALQRFVPTGAFFEGPGVTLRGSNASSSTRSASGPTDAFSQQDLLDARVTEVKFEIGSFEIVPTDASLFPPSVDVSGSFSYVLRDTTITLLPEPAAAMSLGIVALATRRVRRKSHLQ
ncbi:MAG: hypothetical protein AAF916_06015 [Planctomycetota bacterium]